MKTDYGFIASVHIFLVLLMLQHLLAINPLPHKKCHLEDNICLTSQAKAVLKAFIKGIPELGIKPLERMYFEHVDVKKNNVHYEMWNTYVEGFNTTVVDDVRINKLLNVIQISFQVDFVFNYDYKADGTQFDYPFFGQGPSQMKLKNVDVHMIISFDIVKNEQGKDIINLKSLYYGADPVGGVHHYFGNLFNGDKQRSAAVHAVVNKSWRAVVANYGRFFTDAIMEEAFKAVKTYLLSWPLEDLAIYP